MTLKLKQFMRMKMLMKNSLDWFRSHIGKRIYKIEGDKKDPASRDGIFVYGQEHAKKLFDSGVKYSDKKRWNF
jgi:hypothetical protein